jgi:hypothetical protein
MDDDNFGYITKWKTKKILDGAIVTGHDVNFLM